MKEYKYVILGGGLGGLVAAKRLLELGQFPLVIEAGNYPCHKVCGEFLSPSALPILKQWGIQPHPIRKIYLHAQEKKMEFLLSREGGSMSHFTLDTLLANQIILEGAQLMTSTLVVDLISPSQAGQTHVLTLSNGEKIRAHHLLLGTGRLPHASSKSKPRYIGIKSHFSGLFLESSLHMFALKGAYLGISPIENGFSNIACLAKIKSSIDTHSIEKFMNALINSHGGLKSLLSSGVQSFDWMLAFVPEFGQKKDSLWLQTYRIGDAAATIPPASGSGLTLAIISGYMAAEYAAKGEAMEFRKLWKKRTRFQILAAKGLHQLFLNDKAGCLAMNLCRLFPNLGSLLFHWTTGESLSSSYRFPQ